MTPTSLAPSLVVLAAGLGSRFGGMKQLAPVGPSGETLMEYSLFDAREAGFGRVVFVIRPEMESVFEAYLSSRFHDGFSHALAFQALDDVPVVDMATTRVKPWGTAHAVLAARTIVDGAFAVVNADDFYGRAALQAMATSLSETKPGHYSLVGYRMDGTTSEAGSVNRGLIRAIGRRVEGIEEIVDIQKMGDAFNGLDIGGLPRALNGADRVSMNLWGFGVDLFARLEKEFVRFLALPDAQSREFQLPTAVQTIMKRGEVSVELLEPDSHWYGVTYPADQPLVAKAIAALVERGDYPRQLWMS